LISAGEPKKRRVISGMRPTGRLHIGNYFGALANWVRLQDDPSNECFYFIADWHSLTSDYADTSAIAENTIQVATDFIAAGLDPKKSTIFLQSSVPEHAELHLLLSMITPLGWLERVPTYKEALENIKGKDLHMYGFLGYPVLQTADIVIYGQEGVPLVVPVGEDQVAHIELSREIVRRFDFIFGGVLVSPEVIREEKHAYLGHIEARLARHGEKHELMLTDRSEKSRNQILETINDAATRVARRIGYENFLEEMMDAKGFFSARPILTESEAMLTQAPRIPGTDGRKMSKSYGNAIELGESDESIRAKTKVMMTDPARKRRTDKGNPDVCPVYDWHKLFSPPETLSWANTGCRTAGIGCIECKAAMADNLIKWIGPVRARRQELEARPDQVLNIIDEGSMRARKTAQATMERVRQAVFGWKAKRESVAMAKAPAALKNSGAGN
jgi:tryptophanyl-tRNA synthetase